MSSSYRHIYMQERVNLSYEVTINTIFKLLLIDTNECIKIGNSMNLSNQLLGNKNNLSISIVPKKIALLQC